MSILIPIIKLCYNLITRVVGVHHANEKHLSAKHLGAFLLEATLGVREKDITFVVIEALFQSLHP